MTDLAGFEALTQQVRELLSGILRPVDFPGSDELLRQVASVDVVGGPVTMLNLRITQPTPASTFTGGPAPLSATVINSGGAAIGELLLWVENGYLNTLEFAWWTDKVPDKLPSLDHVRVTQK